MFQAGIQAYASTNCIAWVVLSKFVKSGIESAKTTRLTIRLTALIAARFFLSMKQRIPAPATGRKISIVSIGKPGLFVIVCSMVTYLRNMIRTMASAPAAMIAA
ncbi:MAG: hypothetical protein OHK006_16410 [Thermodesulfovibrionales bacterium]